jgi:fatty-acyl-CoA synthase
MVWIGGSSIVCQAFDVDQVFDLVREGGVTVFFGVPTMFVMMQSHPRWAEADFSQQKFIISGGAPCPMPVFEKFWAKGVDFKTGYGLTEAGPNNFWLPPEDVRRKPGAVGQPMFFVEAKIIDEHGRDIDEHGVAGELCVRGPHVMPGYWNKPEATREAIDEDGWLHTGDLAEVDEEGYFSIAGRKKDLIISGGENVYPAEIESVLHAHPAVDEAAVIGIPDDTWGEVGCAFVVANQPIEEDSLLADLKKELASYKVPKRVVAVDELPKTGAGKVDKRALKASLEK